MIKFVRCLALAAVLAVACPAVSFATALNINFGTFTGPASDSLASPFLLRPIADEAGRG